MNKRSIFFAVGLIILGGCVPVVTKYPKFDMPGAVYFHLPGFGAASPPLVVYYPYHGIHISLFLHTLFFGLHVPEGTVVQLNDTVVRIRGILAGAGTYDVSFNIQAAPHSYLGDAAKPFRGLPDPYTSSDSLGPLAGAGNGEKLVWYLFMGVNPENSKWIVYFPKNLTEGTITLPSLTINGQRYESQSLSFEQKAFAGLECVNC
jgi:hypothetical protein